ncbi:MAG: hypothetical protein H7138_03255, partial [Myxococcales bacterium]|nr:hypothetical protein [Myxococcales bacterium]
MTAAGAVELWHLVCFDDRDALVTRSTPADFLPTPPTPRFIRVLGGVVAGSMLVAIVVGQWTWGEMAPPLAASLANIELTAPELVFARHVDTARERLPSRIVTVETEVEARYRVPVDGSDRLDETFPSLRDWVHPVTGTAERMPPQVSRQFGSERHGIERAECGEGHCGIDLDGPRGRPIV